MYGEIPAFPVLGITGGLATGKSLVTRLLKARGAVTFSADEAARAVFTHGGVVFRQVVAAFGESILTPAGALDRKALGQRVFQDVAARERLNAITHPPILTLLRAQIAGVQDDFSRTTLIAVEVPLLFEAHMEDWFGAILVVSSPFSLQLARLQTRNGLTEAEARQRILAQWPLAEKERRADLIVRNEGSMEQVAAEVERALASLPQGVAANRHSRVSGRVK